MKIMVAFLGKKRKKQKINEIRKSSIKNFVQSNNKLSEYKRINNLKNNNKKIINNIKSNILNEKFNNKKDFSNLREKVEFKSADLLKNSKNNKMDKGKELSKSIAYIFLVIPVLAFVLIKSKKVDNSLLYFATNFRQADEKNIKIADLIATYGLYNSNNYIIKNKDVVQNVEIAKEEIVDNDEQILDKEVEIDDIQTFLGNEKVNIEVTENSKNIQRITVGTSRILNYSSKRDINFESLLNSNITLTKKSDKILLYNTHTSESYTNSEKYKFEYTGTMRTTDALYNMLAIAKRFDENLKSKGFESFHNTTPHDYGTYTSAYAKSRITIQDSLSSMNGAGIIIDVHRDAVADLGFRPVANIKGVQVAQLMFVVGVGSDSVKNDNWEDNLRLALKLQQMADKIYPGLFRPMIIRNSVYNQDLNRFSLLIEFGATGNTIEEVKLSTRCMTNLLNIMYKD